MTIFKYVAVWVKIIMVKDNINSQITTYCTFNLGTKRQVADTSVRLLFFHKKVWLDFFLVSVDHRLEKRETR